MQEVPQRRLAAIVAADVVGYSRLMDADETGTLAALRAHRTDLIDPAIARHGGRIVKTMGDGLLLEFPSIVAAVEFATGVQTELVRRNMAIPAARAIQLRIGVHVGDIIIEADDIFGSGVNIAARIEPLAEPGGVSLSDDAYRQVRDRLEIAWKDGGEQAVKNISRPLQVWHWQREDMQSASRQTYPEERNAHGAKPSIAVLPLDSMSADPEQEYFADGMTEDLITDLSKISGLFVVARNSSMIFKRKPVDIREAARQLGVRYVLEGSVRKAGSLVRINVQLIDGSSGGHLWAERYDGTVDNVFELQDDVSEKVVSALSVRLTGDEDKRLRRVHTSNLDAYELYVQAKATPYPPVPDRIEAAHKLFQRVTEMDPDFAGGHAGVSWTIGISMIFGHAEPAEPAAQAEALARRAIELDDGFGWSFVALALALLLRARHDEALAAMDEAISRQPNDADAHAYRGVLLAFAGQPELADAPLRYALQLNPQFVYGPYLNMLGIVRTMARRYEDAIQAFEDNVARHGPIGPPALAWSAVAYLSLGRKQEAERAVRLLLDLAPGFRLSTWNVTRLIRSPEERAKFIEIMQAAGLPE